MQGRFSTIRRILIAIIAGFLILLHVVGLLDLYGRGGTTEYSTYTNLQSLLSVCIIISLVFVILAKRLGLLGMWLSITALVLTQYWAHFGFVEADFTAGRSVFSYLRGYMIPSVITALFFLPLQAK